MIEYLKNFFALIGVICLLATALLIACALLSNIFETRNPKKNP